MTSQQKTVFLVSAYAHRRIETQSNRNNRLQAMVRDVLEVLPEVICCGPRYKHKNKLNLE